VRGREDLRVSQKTYQAAEGRREGMLKSSSFVDEIEKLCFEKDIEYIDAVVFWCEKNKLEIETAAYWIKKDPVMRAKIQVEAENLNILKSGARLPV
jgi:hypothetical protein